MLQSCSVSTGQKIALLPRTEEAAHCEPRAGRGRQYRRMQMGPCAACRCVPLPVHLRCSRVFSLYMFAVISIALGCIRYACTMTKKATDKGSDSFYVCMFFHPSCAASVKRPNQLGGSESERCQVFTSPPSQWKCKGLPGSCGEQAGLCNLRMMWPLPLG